MTKQFKILVMTAALMAPAIGHASENVDSAAREKVADYTASTLFGASTGTFAPYMIGSLNHGKTQMKSWALADVSVVRGLDHDRRFSWGFGGEFLFGFSHKAQYARWQPEPGQWDVTKQGPASIWLQQVYAEVKYRSVFLTAGMKERGSALLNQRLSSGDLVESGNARPIPQVRAGFIDFQNIPFTNGWVQIQGEISYGKMVDNTYNKNHYNYYNYHIHLGALYSYKRCYFRTNPDKPFSIIAGMQTAAFFGGETQYYQDGHQTKEMKFSSSLKTFFKVFFPFAEGGEDYYTGQTLGSWDCRMRYRLPNRDEIFAYFQGPWEDGTGIGRRNGLDGLWGLEYKASRPGIITGAVFELLDFRNQSGPIHWQPNDTPGTPILTHVQGRDNYYNNGYYNAYANYGMAIGTPFLMSPIYNQDGYPAFASNRACGFHAGLSGLFSKEIDYRFLVGYQRGLGNYDYAYPRPRTNTSMLFEAGWDASVLARGLSARLQLAFDAGSLRGNNFGGGLTITYKGEIW
ncbi:MAG: capsule assembly Wzi family protein [Muribaculaceae bacterium]|nr:capsule assembly Wzi family protein [Muribaculaceae bacterium]